MAQLDSLQTNPSGPSGVWVNVNHPSAPRPAPPSQVGVIRYSGFWSEANYSEHLVKLQTALRAADLAWEGEPVYSRYNPPFTPWFMRRNEIWLHLATRP